jgi:hypothetical protein
LFFRLQCSVALSFLAVAIGSRVEAQTVNFLTDVQPVLTEKCLSCHTGEAAQAGLKIHTREELLQGGKSGAAIVPGKGSESLLIAKMEGRKGMRMPPSGPPLSAEVIDRIKTWIDQGATFSGAALKAERIAPIAPRNPAIPEGAAQNPVDRFVDAYLSKNKIAQPQIVDDGKFARRVAYDITGLPLNPERLRAFEADTAPDKRTRLIDTLLADRQAYAEHWMSYWNDLLRNDEGVVYHGERKTITKWLFDSLSNNRPYDQMVRALLDPPADGGSEGFLVGVTWRGVVSASQTPPMQAAQNAAQVFLGINLKCAACHDSFINRWQLKDTFGLANLFSEEPLDLVRCDIPLGQKSEAKFLYQNANFPIGDSPGARRKAAADWFVDTDNGRFARTIVNRYWDRFLGRGLVEPVDDMDALPWNEDLLDWLASDFVKNGHDLQHLIKTILSSRAYQMEAVAEKETPKAYVFRGPQLRRLSAEQFDDTISAVTGSWRVNSPRSETFASYTRQWRMKSDPLSRVLGRPIRDQVYTERSMTASTLQALELTNGPLLSQRLERGARELLGQSKPAPVNLFDSKLVRNGAVPVDVDISGAKELWLLIEDVDSYDRSRVIAGWANAELIGPQGAVKLASLPAKQNVTAEELRLKDASAEGIRGAIPSMLAWDIAGKGFTRFLAQAAVDERSRQSDISPAIRFFVFGEKPDPDHLIRVQGNPPIQQPQPTVRSAELTERLYAHLLSRKPTDKERQLALAALGGEKASAAGLEDLLWAMLMSPEFQYIH